MKPLSGRVDKWLSRLAHNQENGGSNPPPAPTCNWALTFQPNIRGRHPAWTQAVKLRTLGIMNKGAITHLWRAVAKLAARGFRASCPALSTLSPAPFKNVGLSQKYNNLLSNQLRAGAGEHTFHGVHPSCLSGVKCRLAMS